MLGLLISPQKGKSETVLHWAWVKISSHFCQFLEKHSHECASPADRRGTGQNSGVCESCLACSSSVRGKPGHSSPFWNRSAFNSQTIGPKPWVLVLFSSSVPRLLLHSTKALLTSVMENISRGHEAGQAPSGNREVRAGTRSYPAACLLKFWGGNPPCKGKSKDDRAPMAKSQPHPHSPMRWAL